MKVLAILAAYNEERFIAACLEHFIEQGVDVYLIDNASTDRTVTIAERFLHRGLIGIESAPRHDVYSWKPLLERKEELASALDYDWFIHADPDEIRLAPDPGKSLLQAFSQADAAGYNAVNFTEFVFVPTRESPDHDHPNFQETMRWYYAHIPPGVPSQVKAWKRQRERVDLASAGGHRATFPGQHLCPRPFPMRHYMFLSVEHALEKWVQRRYDPAEVAAGWHRARAAVRPEHITLPRECDMREYVSDERLDASAPLPTHPFFIGASSDPGARGT
jgi:Glycosyl transferase family 2